MVVKEYLSDKGGFDYLTKKYSICDPVIVRTWVNQYKEFGEKGLFRARKHQQYSLELKLQALEMHETTEMSYREIANKL